MVSVPSTRSARPGFEYRPVWPHHREGRRGGRLLCEYCIFYYEKLNEISDENLLHFSWVRPSYQVEPVLSDGNYKGNYSGSVKKNLGICMSVNPRIYLVHGYHAVSL